MFQMGYKNVYLGSYNVFYNDFRLIYKILHINLRSKPLMTSFIGKYAILLIKGLEIKVTETH